MDKNLVPIFVKTYHCMDNRQQHVGGHRRRIFPHSFEELISVENLLCAWQEFLPGKRKKKDVQRFSINLIDHILELHGKLANHIYSHGSYQAFRINDPKPRHIHKASVCDRLLHHAVHRPLYQFFDSSFSCDSFSCRLNKGTHSAINRLLKFYRKVSRNNTLTCWVLKCDIRKFFDNINHEILIRILKKHIADFDIIWLLEKIIYSFSKTPGKGLPLGNLTSQLFVNIYMNEFDQFIKRELKACYYIRFADDFVILSHDKSWLEELIFKIGVFLSENLKLELHPDKISIRTFYSGVDFLGWVNFPGHRVLRTTTKRRMVRKLTKVQNSETVNSYMGLLKHGNTYKIKKALDNI